MTIRIPVSADFNGADAEAAIAKLHEQMNRLAQAVAGANRVQFNPVSTGALEEVKKIEARFKELTRISGGLRERIKATGQAGSTFGGLDWSRLYEDPAIRARKMQQAFQHVTAGSRYAVQGPAAPPPGSPPPAPPGAPPSGPTIGGVFGGAAGAGMRAAGPVGGVIANAAGAGMSGGLGAGMMGLLGGLAALAVGKGVSAVKEKIDAAGQEGIGYDTLKRTLGDVNVSFDLLRNSLRAASDNIDVTFEQSQKLGTDFAKLSGISKEQYKTLADEVSIGGGFGRSFGMDPSESNQFFAQMRQFGATSNTADSRKMALMIGEAVAKSGSFSKADELMSAIASYTANQARNGLAAPNVAGYSGLLAGMVGSGIPGLDPQGAAALLGRVNNSISGGGSAGEAGQNFMFSVLGKKHGLDPVQAMLLQQQGAFGTGRSAFGSKLYKDFTAKFGGGVSAGAANSDEMNITAILARLQKDYAGNRSLMLNATARTLGVNETQAMALHTVDGKDLNSMGGRMARLKLNMSNLSGTGISALSQIESGNRDTLIGQANSLLGNKKEPLSEPEAKKLREAMKPGESEEKLRDILTELTYSRSQEQTEGDKTRKSIQDVDKSLQRLATYMVPAMNDMRNAMVYLAGNGGKKTASQINKEMANLEYAEKVDPLKERLSQINRQIEIGAIPKDGIIRGGRGGHKLTPSEIETKKKHLESLHKERSDIYRQMDDARLSRDVSSSPGATPERLAALLEADRELGLTPGTSAGLFQTESGFDGSKVSKQGARGFAQIMPREHGVMNKRFGRQMDPTKFGDSLEMYKNMMAENMKHFKGDQNLAIRGYHGGWDKTNWGPANAAYGPSVTANAAKYTAMPEGSTGFTGSQPGVSNEVTEHNVMLMWPNRQQAAEPLTIKRRVFGPQANGTWAAQR